LCGELDGSIAYKPGLTADIIERMKEHRRSFGKQIVLIDAFSLSHLDYKRSKNFDNRVKAYFESANLLYPVKMINKKNKESAETILLRNGADINKIISFVKDMAPTEATYIELRLSNFEF
jgi:hypothetical protein